MAFGQQSGPPATAKQVSELLALLQTAGHSDFRDARGPMGFTQRQAAGKFTRDEATELIGRLEAAADDKGETVAVDTAPPARPRPIQRPAPAATLSAAEQTLRRIPTNLLAAELQRRGWIVVEP